MLHQEVSVLLRSYFICIVTVKAFELARVNDKNRKVETLRQAAESRAEKMMETARR